MLYHMYLHTICHRVVSLQLMAHVVYPSVKCCILRWRSAVDVNVNSGVIWQSLGNMSRWQEFYGCSMLFTNNR